MNPYNFIVLFGLGLFELVGRRASAPPAEPEDGRKLKVKRTRDGEPPEARRGRQRGRDRPPETGDAARAPAKKRSEAAPCSDRRARIGPMS